MENIGIIIGQFLMWAAIVVVIFGVLEVIPLFKVLPGFKYIGGVLVILFVDISLITGGYVAVSMSSVLEMCIVFCLACWYAIEGYSYWKKRIDSLPGK